ncbi:DUF4102 domain-containing protein, partial [Pseudomonas gessardii]
MPKLTVKTVDSLVKAAAPGLTGDGEGLYFQISRTGGTSWVFRFKIAGKARTMGLGRYPETTLADARQKAADARKLSKAGVDPLAAREEERNRQQDVLRQLEARRRTFEMVAVEYRDAHGEGWSSKWRKGWLRKLELYAF